MSADLTAYQKFPGLTPQRGYQAVPCGTCMAKQGEPCGMGGESWGRLAHTPHQARRQAAHLVAWWNDYGADTAAS